MHETDGGMNPNDYTKVIDNVTTVVVPIEERDTFGENLADEYGNQDYGFIIDYQKQGTFHKDEIKEILKQIKEDEEKQTKFKKDCTEAGETIQEESMTVTNNGNKAS